MKVTSSFVFSNLIEISHHNFNRSVLLYTTPRVYVEDITVRTDLIGDTGIVKYLIQPAGLREGETPTCWVTLHDAEDTLAIKEPVYGLSGTLKIPFARLWWPRGVDPKPGYLYTLEVHRSDK